MGIRTWWIIYARNNPGALPLPGRVAMGGLIDIIASNSPPANRRAKKGSILVDNSTTPPSVYVNADGAFTWCQITVNC
jgi:hypothetical protein